MTRRPTLAERVAARTQRTDGCWFWTGNISPDHGYGRLGINGRNYRAHRISYELAKGPIPEGLDLDHLCRVRHCVNPDHLEPVTRRENTLRGIGPAAQYARSTTCTRGHERTPENTVIQRGVRLCRPCRDLRDAEYRERTRKRPPWDPDHCTRGHEWTEQNTYIQASNGRRNCRACHRDRTRASRAARKENAS